MASYTKSRSRMKVAIDIREALAENPTGKGMWTKHILNELKNRDLDLITFPMPDANSQKPIANGLLWHWKTSLKIKSLKPDVYLSPTSYIVPWLLGKSVPTAVVIHDLIAFDHEPHDKKAQLIERLTLPRVLKTAKYIFTVSEATKDDLLKRFPKTDPEKVTVIYAGPTLSAVPLRFSSPNTIRKIKQSACNTKQCSNYVEGQQGFKAEIHDSAANVLPTVPLVAMDGVENDGHGNGHESHRGVEDHCSDFGIHNHREKTTLIIQNENENVNPATEAITDTSPKKTGKKNTAAHKCPIPMAISAIRPILEPVQNIETQTTTSHTPQTITQESIIGSYILSIGTLCPRKNQLRLIQAFNKLSDDIRHSHKLILAGGRGWDDEEIVKLAEESENVEWVGYVPDEELTELLKNAKLLAYPSLKEGFGFPVLDAMTLGVPVLTSNGSSMREIVEEAGMLIDPTSVGVISEKLGDLLTNSTLRQSLIDKGLERSNTLSWKKTVDRMLKSLEN